MYVLPSSVFFRTLSCYLLSVQSGVRCLYTVKPRFIIFVEGVLKNNNGYGKMIDTRAYILFVQGTETFNNGPGDRRSRFHCSMWVVQLLRLVVRFEVFTAVTMKSGIFWDIKHSLYFTGDTLHLHYRVQPVNAM
jgi:hypothetical protein